MSVLCVNDQLSTMELLCGHCTNINIQYKNFGPYCRAELHGGRVACCPLVSYSKYAPRALLRLEKNGTDGRTDARPLHYVYR